MKEKELYNHDKKRFSKLLGCEFTLSIFVYRLQSLWVKDKMMAKKQKLRTFAVKNNWVFIHVATDALHFRLRLQV